LLHNLDLKELKLIPCDLESIDVLLLALAAFVDRRCHLIEEEGRDAFGGETKSDDLVPVHEKLDLSIVVQLPHESLAAVGVSHGHEYHVVGPDKCCETLQVIATIIIH